MQARPESDEVLVKRLLPGVNPDPVDRAAAWDEWYTRVGRASVLSFIQVQNNTAEPDVDILHDALATAFLEVERGRYTPFAGVPFTAYVKGIARNRIREARRLARRFVCLEDVAHDLRGYTQDQPEVLVEIQEQRDALYSSLARLNESRRQVLEGYLRGRSTAEIAATLGISEALVRQHKCRGLRSLREASFLAPYR